MKIIKRIKKAIKEAEDDTVINISDKFKEALEKTLFKYFKKFEKGVILNERRKEKRTEI